MAYSLFLTASNIKRNTFMDNNVDESDIRIAISDAQNLVLQPVLGDGLYSKLLSDILNKNLAEDYQNLVHNYIWPVLYQAVPYELYSDVLYRLTRSSYVKDSNENSTAIESIELRSQIHKREKAMNYFIDKLKDHLNAYGSTYPEFLGTVPIDGKAPDRTDTNTLFYDWET